MKVSKLFPVVIAAAALGAVGCNKDRVEAGVNDTETRSTLMDLKEGAGQACPQIAGQYSCVDDGTQDAHDVQITQGVDGQNRPIVTIQGNQPAQPTLITRAFEDYVMNIGGGLVADGSIQDQSINILGTGVQLKYAVSCAGDVLSLHVIAGQTGSRTTLEKGQDGAL